MIISCQIWLTRTGSCGSCSSQNNMIWFRCDEVASTTIDMWNSITATSRKQLHWKQFLK
jgi:hypothetical protein